jgi:hypothetical protein
VLLPVIMQQLKQHINTSNHDEILQCTAILSVMIDTVQTKIKVITLTNNKEIIKHLK